MRAASVLQRRSLSVCMPHPFRNTGRFQCAARTLKAIGAAEQKGSGLRDYFTSQYTAGPKSTTWYTSWLTAHARVDGGSKSSILLLFSSYLVPFVGVSSCCSSKKEVRQIKIRRRDWTLNVLLTHLNNLHATGPTREYSLASLGIIYT